VIDTRLDLYTATTVPNGWPGLICRYADYLPVTDKTPIVTLHEGNTPLIPAIALSQRLGRNIKVLLKYDGLNPTGSFKDRGMTMAISKAKEIGSEAVICASTGNTSAAAAAYAKRGGLKAFVLIPDGKIAIGKLSQALIYGAEVIAINGNFDHPYRLEGQKTAAFELVEAIGDAPDWLCIPMGNAGNITAYWMGFSQYYASGKSTKLPRMMGFQAAGAAPLVTGKIFESPETIATAIRIGNPANWVKALKVREDSDGAFHSVTDVEILAAYKFLASEEGVFCEPASAASVAGLLKISEQIPSGATIVCVLTGNGIKDPDTAIACAESKLHKGIDPNITSVAKVMGF